MARKAKKVMNVCVVGTGNISERHVSGWQQLPYAQLSVACDIDAKVAAAYAKKHGFQSSCTDYKEALAREDVDVVSVCTPAGIHADVAVAAAENGKHVLCEKPMALTAEDCDRMIEAADKARVKLQIAHMERFSEQTELLRELLSSGVIGRPVMVIKGNAGFNPHPVFHDKFGNGGPVVDGCVHAFDTWRVVFESDPVRVTGRGFVFGTHRKELKSVKDLAFDTVTAIIEYASGDTCTLLTTNSLPPAIKREQHLRVEEYIGPMGTIIGGVRTGLTLVRTDGSVETFPQDNFQEWFHKEVKAFAEAVQSNKKVPITGDDGKMAVRVALAILESVESGQTVTL